MRLVDADALEKKAIYMHGFGQNKYVPLKAIEAAPTIEAEPKWISTKDRLPPEEELVLVCATCGTRPRVGMWQLEDMYGEFIWLAEHGFIKKLSDAPYWMPMPKTPKEVQHGKAD